MPLWIGAGRRLQILGALGLLVVAVALSPLLVRGGGHSAGSATAIVTGSSPTPTASVPRVLSSGASPAASDAPPVVVRRTAPPKQPTEPPGKYTCRPGPRPSYTPQPGEPSPQVPAADKDWIGGRVQTYNWKCPINPNQTIAIYWSGAYQLLTEGTGLIEIYVFEDSSTHPKIGIAAQAIPGQNSIPSENFDYTMSPGIHSFTVEGFILSQDASRIIAESAALTYPVGN